MAAMAATHSRQRTVPVTWRTSRSRISAGSVALADEFSAVYPGESPGGWQLIGRTETVLWDIDRAQPALLSPGMRVRFRAVGMP
jgi:allophanate hydrolase subunit 1